MKRRTTMFILLLALVLGGTAFGWTSWAGAQKNKRGGEQQNAAERDSQPDTRRDVFVEAARAPRAADISGGQWFNSAPLTSENLRGRVVLVDFWTFGCYNCRNTLPTLKRLDAAYRAKGLTIVGVHAPESDYEKDAANVRREVQRLGIKYPVVTDNNYDTWRAYAVQAWPTIVILDKQGRIRFTHIGEGMYEQQEQIIQKLLAENDARAAMHGAETDMQEKIMKTEDEWRRELSPEQYRVLREKGTEQAFSGEYNSSKEHGTYECAACGNRLFSSAAKFESGTGWPSFYQPISQSSVNEHVDRAYGMTRTEVVCARCDSHLGHVFDDGPQPTGLRYCMNSVALKIDKHAGE